MNNNFKNFIKEKKDLLIFLGVLVVTFISVLTIASVVNKQDDNPTGGIVTPPIDDITPTPIEPKENPKFQLPIKDKYVISREFFDLETDLSTLVNAVMTNGTTYVESKGISYRREDNKVFDVYNVYPGEVISVSGNSENLEGYTITIKHENDLVSTYSSLSNVNVEVGDILNENVKIGVSGTSIKDIAAGIHVHLTLLCQDEYINPKNAIGKETSELASFVK